eukprot:1496248-Pleurochrysis_carterae.AAC.1
MGVHVIPRTSSACDSVTTRGPIRHPQLYCLSHGNIAVWRKRRLEAPDPERRSQLAGAAAKAEYCRHHVIAIITQQCFCPHRNRAAKGGRVKCNVHTAVRRATQHRPPTVCEPHQHVPAFEYR